MKRFFTFVVMLVLVAIGSVYAQNQVVKKISELNGQIVNLPTEGIRLTDSDANGNFYADGENYTVTFIDTSCYDPNRLTLAVDEFDVEPGDTLFIYDGPSTNSQLLCKANNNASIYASRIYATGNSITLRFKSNNNGQVGKGFSINVDCEKPCQTIELEWDTIFYRVVDGVDYEKKVTYDYELDTIFDSINTDVVIGFDTLWFYAFDLCFGDRATIPVKTSFPENDLYYHQSVELTKYKWTFGDGGVTERFGDDSPTHYYQAVQGYDLSLVVTDTNGCLSTKSLVARVRIAKNPIKTIFNLPTICNTSYATIKVGSSNDATIITEPISFVKEAAAENNSRTFVPDGNHCDVQCYEAPVRFTEFPAGRKIQSANDICSICVNMEHEYMGDLKLSIKCPEGQFAVLKYKEPQQTDNVTGEIRNPGGGGTNHYFGLPYGGNAHHTYDGGGNTSGYCDSLYNIPGVGWTYCWSNNTDYGYRDAAGNINAPLANAIYVVDNSTQVPVQYDFGSALPNGYLETDAAPGQQSFNTTDSSHRTAKMGFYKPSQDFNNLVGCSLNGQWSIEVCDTWSQDNGWVFSWSMELCNINTSDWTYNVGIDTILWSERTPGINIDITSSSTSKVSTPDTSGFFILNVSIIDSFGCQWDTCTGITTIWTPRPSLGPDTALCDDERFLLNADDGKAAQNNYTYIWSPTYETTPEIWTLKTGGIATNYVVEVTNTMEGVRCPGRDDRVVDVAPKPIPNFDISGLPFIEGCEPLDIKIKNRTIGADKYRWEFGDGHISEEENPSHLYYAGLYDFKYYAISHNGCIDSIQYKNFVSVYPSPKAKFSWNPETPTVLHPDVQFNNLTMPHNSDNIYYWKIQYDKDLTQSVTTLKEYEPTYTFRAFDDQSIAGEYKIQLVAMTKNLAPSGNYIVCADTADSRLVLVNDFLQFPNVITANGDGINDVFAIKNLVDGLGYPTNELSIFDRWGKRVYHKENITSEEDFWDPGAENIPAGTYFYRFVGKGYLGNIQRNGVIEVLR